MNIVVCVKQIVDPEIPMDKFLIKDNRVVPPQGIPPVISPYDAQAVEVALQLREKHGGKVTALSLGTPEAVDVVRHALSMGADEGVVVSDRAFEDADSLVAGVILGKAIRKLGACDLVLCGREAADWNMGVAGAVITEELGLSLITLAMKVELLNPSTIKVERVVPDGYQVFDVVLPAVISVSKEVGLPRLPTGRGIIRAAQQKIAVWTAADIALDQAAVRAGIPAPQLTSLATISRERKCEYIGGETIEELATNLTDKLQRAGMI